MAGLAVGLWLVLGLVVWNALFDREIKAAESRYLRLQAAHEQGRGPDVTIPGIMEPAKRRGVLVATGWTAVLMVAGLGGIAAVRRRREP